MHRYTTHIFYSEGDEGYVAVIWCLVALLLAKLKKKL